MAILIPSMVLPENCGECSFNSYGYCNVAMMHVKSAGRDQNCPLREVKLPKRDPAAEKLLKEAGWE